MNTAPETKSDSIYPDDWADDFVRQNGGDREVMAAWFDAAMSAVRSDYS